MIFFIKKKKILYILKKYYFFLYIKFSRKLNGDYFSIKYKNIWRISKIIVIVLRKRDSLI
jgi:hypothetical protein